MIDVKNLVDMILTECLEEQALGERSKPKENLPSIDYQLELIKDEKGKLYWVEG